MKHHNGIESVCVKLKLDERLELDEVVRRLGYPTRKSFFMDIVRGVLTAIDGNDRNTAFVFVPIPRSLVEKYIEKNVSIQELVLKILLGTS